LTIICGERDKHGASVSNWIAGFVERASAIKLTNAAPLETTGIAEPLSRAAFDSPKLGCCNGRGSETATDTRV
jgi:hypothetical protein